MSLLTHLQRLEGESIHIIREVVAECERPVMLYSIGKDSSVLLHLAMKAFFPAKPPFPFPLLHVDTTWKFRELIAFRDETAKRLVVDLLVHINFDGVAMGVNPFRHGSAIHTDVMKTQALKQALEKYGFDAALRRRPPRRREVAGQGARLFDALCTASVGPEATTTRALAPLQRAQAEGGERSRVSTVELDRARRLAVSPSGEPPDRAAVLDGRSVGRGQPRRRSLPALARTERPAAFHHLRQR
jgi:Phosphoadenosine phosphosulfate reductase family